MYKVKARYRSDKLGEFLHKLTDGTIANQQPDGEEIVSAMQAARITAPGFIEWFETCYYSTPLQHERETVYDRFLSGISTELVEASGEVDGESFWSYLHSKYAVDH